MAQSKVFVNGEEVEELHIQGPGVEGGKQWEVRIQAVLKKREEKRPHRRKIVTLTVGEKTFRG